MMPDCGIWTTRTVSRCLLCGVILVTALVTTALAGTGCASRSQDGGYKDHRIAACRGSWRGHVRLADGLCAPGWDVCNWDTHAHILRKVTWDRALSIDGCYAYNAAQDGGRCRECRNHLERDDLAGIGRGCPHQNHGQTSCISGGRIDASCCVDSHQSLHRACEQQPGIDGVMCCRMSARRPEIIAPPPERMDVHLGRIFLLTCQARGVPTPRVQWYKDGAKVPSDNSRISVLLSGDLLVTLARKSDSGQYICEVINEEGVDIASSNVLVKEHSSGCADGSTEGLSIHKNIHACEGRWKGHVKQGSTLCQPGWRVCSNHDEDLMKELSWLDIFDLKGCYAYNAGNDRKGKCRRCRHGKGRMAGVGSTCGRVKYSKKSCLSQGRIDVYKNKSEIPTDNSCSYKEGITTGVLCCKRRKSSSSGRKKKPLRPHCSLGCENGGVCMGYNVCMCPVGYKGAMCQNAICKGGCGSRAKCVSPGKCECIKPYTGKDCREKHTLKCSSPCLNGGRCRRGKCKCPTTHYGSSCQHLFQHILLTHQNRTER